MIHHAKCGKPLSCPSSFPRCCSSCCRRAGLPAQSLMFHFLLFPSHHTRPLDLFRPADLAIADAQPVAVPLRNGEPSLNWRPPHPPGEVAKTAGAPKSHRPAGKHPKLHESVHVVLYAMRRPVRRRGRGVPVHSRVVGWVVGPQSRRAEDAGKLSTFDRLQERAMRE